jgi:predicted transcriptional regulator
LSDSLPNRQQAYLLHQLANAPDGKLVQSEADKATPTQLRKELQFTPAKHLKELRRQLVSAGLIGEEKVGRVVTHSITDAGRQRLRELERYIPLLAAKGAVNPPADDGVKVARVVYILDALARAQRQTIPKADLDAGFGTKPKAGELATQHADAVPFRTQECLRLNAATARAVLTDLALRDEVQVHRSGASESYTLTPTGAERLARLREECPVLPPTGKPTPAPNEAIAQAREAFLLLKLLEAPNHSATAAVGNKLSYPKPFKLNHATAWQVRRELVRQGHLTVHWDGKEGSYTLTTSGKRHLATLSFDSFGEMKIKGHALTQLLAAAREGRTIALSRPAPVTPSPTLSDVELESTVMDTFQELLRGPFATLRMVPIHEVRREIAKRFGVNGVAHAAFNDALLDLRRTDRVQLVSIDDRSRATPEQLRDSVFAVGETFFYMEKPSGLASG